MERVSRSSENAGPQRVNNSTTNGDNCNSNINNNTDTMITLTMMTLMVEMMIVIVVTVLSAYIISKVTLLIRSYQFTVIICI